MDNSASATVSPNGGLPFQFSLRDVAVGTAATAIFLSCYGWLGKDGLLLAALVAPTISIPILSNGSFTRRARMTATAILLTLGVTWCILFPKTWDVFRPDMFASILLGVGLIGGGMLLRRKRFTVMILCTLLLWSVLLNLALLNNLNDMASLLKSMTN